MNSMDTTIEWYESKVADKTNTVLQVTCGKKQFWLVIKRDQVESKEQNIVEWFEKIKTNCEGKNK